MPQALRNFSIPIGLAALLSLAYSPFGAAAEQPALAANAVAYAAPEGHGIDADKAEQAAIFKKVQGTVVIRPKAAVDGAAGKESTRPVASGDALAVGERVHAGKDAGASLTLSDGTELVLGARSSVVVREYAFNSTTQEGNILLEFLGGQLRLITGLISKKDPESLKVQAPSAVIGVRGTDFVLEAKAIDE